MKYLGNTTNLFSHMKLKHHDTYCKLKSVAKSTMEQPQVQAQVAQPSLCTCLQRQLKFPANSQRAIELTTSVGYFIAKDLMPLSVVKGEGFCNMLEKLERRYQPPSRKKITVNVLPRMYSEWELGDQSYMDRCYTSVILGGSELHGQVLHQCDSWGVRATMDRCYTSVILGGSELHGQVLHQCESWGVRATMGRYCSLVPRHSPQKMGRGERLVKFTRKAVNFCHLDLAEPIRLQNKTT